jgi:spore coat polysaccharide biosynthesis protein SpsF (cytidylyltransferase family)
MPRGSPALVVVQARMSSTRLPGKVLADVEGESMLALLLRRLQRAPSVAEIVVATSDDGSDDLVADAARALGVRVHRGSLEDVLSRFIGAADGHEGPIVRVTGDCPLTDPHIVEAVLECFAGTAGAGYGSNVEPRTFPDGLDVEVFSPEALRRADELAVDPSDREHVTTLMRRRRDLFPAASLTCPDALGHLSWTVDDRDDLEFIRAVAGRLGPDRHTATMQQILDTVRRPPSLGGPDGLRG